MHMERCDPLDPGVLRRWDALGAHSAQIGIDAWCSRPGWGLAVHDSFASEGDTMLCLADDAGIGVFGRMTSEDGTSALVPLDRVWGFGSPIVCAIDDTESVTGHIADRLMADPSWQVCALGGLAEGEALDHAVVSAFGRHVSLYAGETRSRCRASLDGGIDGYLARRSREHRRNIRQAERRSTHRGITFGVDDGHDAAMTISRLHAVESRSWKGLEGSGIEGLEMAALYDRLVGDLGSTGALRCVFAQVTDDHGNTRDVGFILGGVLGDTYRGLQTSYIEEYRDLGVGNLLQWHEVQRMCTEQLQTYDLGMDIDYKRRWAEQLFETRTVLAVRR